MIYDTNTTLNVTLATLLDIIQDTLLNVEMRELGREDSNIIFNYLSSLSSYNKHKQTGSKSELAAAPEEGSETKTP